MQANSPAPDDPPVVAAYLRAGCDRLHDLLSETRKRLAEGTLGRAREAYGWFYGAFRRQIRLEEDVVFPVIERKEGDASTSAYRHTHRALEHALDDMRIALDRGDTTDFAGGYERLQHFWSAHQTQEMRDLYPLADRALSASERALLVARMQHE